MLRVIGFLTCVVIAGAVLATWIQYRVRTRSQDVRDVAEKRAWELYKGYRDATASIDRLLRDDRYRMVLTPEEQEEFRAHVARFNNITDN